MTTHTRLELSQRRKCLNTSFFTINTATTFSSPIRRFSSTQILVAPLVYALRDAHVRA